MMNLNPASKGCKWVKSVVFLILACMMSGCGNEAPKSTFPSQAAKKYERATTLEGLVSDDNGPVKVGTIRVSNEQGAVLAETALQGSDQYKVEVPVGTSLPVILTYYPLQGGEKLIAVVVYPNLSKFDITPLSTAIAKKAKEMGGYTHGNMMVAAQGMGTVPDDNKMTAGFRGDPTKQYGGWH